jgi:hypothetical protein
MDRRQFVTGASVGVAGAVSVYPKPAIAQGARELKMVTIWPKGLPGLQSGADRSRNRSPRCRADACKSRCSPPASWSVPWNRSMPSLRASPSLPRFRSHVGGPVRHLRLFLQRPVRIYRRRNQRMGLLRWRPGAMGRVERGVRPQAVPVRQYRSPVAEVHAGTRIWHGHHWGLTFLRPITLAASIRPCRN